jgi:hypothetical protein
VKHGYRIVQIDPSIVRGFFYGSGGPGVATHEDGGIDDVAFPAQFQTATW